MVRKYAVQFRNTRGKWQTICSKATRAAAQAKADSWDLGVTLRVRSYLAPSD